MWNTFFLILNILGTSQHKMYVSRLKLWFLNSSETERFFITVPLKRFCLTKRAFEDRHCHWGPKTQGENEVATVVFRHYADAPCASRTVNKRGLDTFTQDARDCLDGNSCGWSERVLGQVVFQPTKSMEDGRYVWQWRHGHAFLSKFPLIAVCARQHSAIRLQVVTVWPPSPDTAWVVGATFLGRTLYAAPRGRRAANMSL